MKFAILDSGYVELVESWGSDERVIEAARMSTGKGFQGWGPLQCEKCEGTGEIGCRFINADGVEVPREKCTSCKGNGLIPGDEKLLRYLYEHKHATPFEMAGMVIEVKAPIFVFREWHRHRTQSYNEMSARYTPLPNENYMPTLERCLPKVNEKNRQAAGLKDEASPADVLKWLGDLEHAYVQIENIYQTGLFNGIPKEIARLVLPVGRYSRMRASANLRNWLAFLTLRMDKNAQWEIQQYANAVCEIIAGLFPKTHELFVEGRTK